MHRQMGNSQLALSSAGFSRETNTPAPVSCPVHDFSVSLQLFSAPSQEASVIKDILKDAEARMHQSTAVLKSDLAGVRTGRANPALIEKLHIEYYGTETPLLQLASISVPEPRSLLIKPFDPSTLKGIEKAIQASDLGLTPNSDGRQIRLNLPPLNEERRRELVKHVHHRLEDARIAVRNIRRDAVKDMKEAETEKLVTEDEFRRGEDDLQKLTEKMIEEIEALGRAKEQEIMEV
jgi:ribosome recycling factor